MTAPKCPQCGGELETVRNPSGSMLNDHQFNSIKAGDYQCPACPDNGRAKKGGCYWWEREVKAWRIREHLDELASGYVTPE